MSADAFELSSDCPSFIRRGDRWHVTRGDEWITILPSGEVVEGFDLDPDYVEPPEPTRWDRIKENLAERLRYLRAAITGVPY